MSVGKDSCSAEGYSLADGSFERERVDQQKPTVPKGVRQERLCKGVGRLLAVAIINNVLQTL